MSSPGWYPRCEVALIPVMDGFADPSSDRAALIRVTPRRANVVLNDYQHPDTWSIDFDAKAYPFEPQQFRELAVAIHMYGAVSADEPWTAQFNDSTQMIVGVAESKDFELSADGNVWSASGGDYTALLKRVPWSGSLKKSAKKKTAHRQYKATGQPIDVAIQALVDELPGVRGVMRVSYEAARAAPLITRPPMPIKEGRSYWDVMFQLVLESNLVCFVRGTDLVITTYQDERQRLARDGFAIPSFTAPAHGTTALQEPSTRFMEWGKNLEKLKIHSEVGGKATPQQVGRFVDPRTRKTVEVIYPTTKDKVTVGIGTDWTRQELVTNLPPGLDTAEQVRAHLEAKYDFEARGELTYTFSTNAIKDMAGRDTLRGFRPGSTVVLGLDKFGDLDMRAATIPGRIRIMKRRGFSDVVAGIVANSYERLVELRRPLYVGETSFLWDVDSGIKIERVDCLNFVSPDRDEGAELAA